VPYAAPTGRPQAFLSPPQDDGVYQLAHLFTSFYDKFPALKVETTAQV
jgi:hypothetical protein